MHACIVADPDYVRRIESAACNVDAGYGDLVLGVRGVKVEGCVHSNLKGRSSFLTS